MFLVFQTLLKKRNEWLTIPKKHQSSFGRTYVYHHPLLFPSEQDALQEWAVKVITEGKRPEEVLDLPSSYCYILCYLRLQKTRSQSLIMLILNGYKLGVC